MTKVKHVLGISGGKDSTALAIYLKQLYPTLDMNYYFCDTGKELVETYDLLKNLEILLGGEIEHLRAAPNSPNNPFDHYLDIFDSYLPSQVARWCTKILKLEPFEKYVGTIPTISYVGIRGDEEREGYISRKSNIQTIFPFRRNIWSQDVITKVLKNSNRPQILNYYSEQVDSDKLGRILEVVGEPLSPNFTQDQKLELLLELGIKDFNHIVFKFLKTTDYPLSLVEDFPLLDNEDNLNIDHIFQLLEDSGIGKPKYYNEKEFKVNGQKGTYFRSRSGCYFCFFQRKIEWVWLYEQHHDLFLKAMEYEKEGYTWINNERLEDLILPDRILQIKANYLKRTQRIARNKKSNLLLDIIQEEEGVGCAACFV